MYFGEYERTVDYKGRLTLPGHLMTTSPDVDWTQIMILRGEGPSLFLYDLATWKAVLSEAYKSMDDDESRLFMHRSLSDAHLSDVDNLKRITVPTALMQHAGIEKKVVVVGMFNRLELWEPVTWTEYMASMEDVEVPGIADLSRARIREVS